MFWRLISILSILAFTSSCILSSDSPIESSSDEVNLVQKGDIVVTNSGNDSIVLLNDDGSFKATLVDSITDAAILFNALIYDTLNKTIIYNFDHTTNSFDAIKKLDLYEGEATTLISNGNLNSTLQGLARLTNGDLVVLKNTTLIEKFNALGQRVTVNFPLTYPAATTVDVAPMINGQFMVCSSSTTNTLRTYTAAGVINATPVVTSTSPTPALAASGMSSCIQAADGTVYVVYSTIATVRAYNSAMTTTLWTYTDSNTLTAGQTSKIAIRSNGNLLIADRGYDHLLELTKDGAFVGVIGGVGLSDPLNIAVVK